MTIKKLNGKVVIVTGASSGIGRATAIEFARMGAKVVLAARNEEHLLEVKKEIGQLNAEAFIVKTDVSKEEECKLLIEKTVAEFGKIDILVNNAGISMRATFSDVNLDVFREVMDINFWGVIYCTKYALPYLLETKGSVVGMLSVAGFRGLPGRSAYSASKFALNGFFEVLRCENHKNGLHVLIVAPGFVRTNIRYVALNKNGNEQGESPRDEDKMMSAEEVASRIVRAIIKRKSYIVMTFYGKVVYHLNRIFPVMFDKVVYWHFAKEPDSPFS